MTSSESTTPSSLEEYKYYRSATEAFLESWERQTQILNALMARITEEDRTLKPSHDGWQIDEQLAHIHGCRKGWLSSMSPDYIEGLGKAMIVEGENYRPIDDLEEIKRQVVGSGEKIGTVVEELIKSGAGRVGPYTHPVQFMQHMLWHEGYHFALIVLALRLAGREPDEIWEERNVWGIWRDPEI